MRSTRKLLLITLLIVLSLAIITACSAGNPAPAAVEGPVEVTPAEEPKEQTIEQPNKEPENQPSEKVPSETPLEAKPAESQNPTEELSETTKEPSKPKQGDTPSLLIEGSGIEEPIALSLDELKSMIEAYYEDDYFSLNSYGTKEYFFFKGIKLGAILEKAGIKESAAGLTFIASDGYKFEFTLEQALKDDYIDEQNPDKKYPVIIAWHENGQDYNASKGAPFRLVIGQKEPGDVNKPQWVQNVSKIIVN